ncbi:uncharacterized protein MONBRDRAFT_32586 [Monosiga brevicollis MX1]|uniref:Uncharacterized protein n=1 Tax=Monosiga brevicollis TaxID=81824 RepID=A9V0H3_MONBE|nr:uncharacterized protein MONBRDRAFT_32586 [Monosiga brevicollis MX1]EDQ89012.1 predicted protein [Monosiga brevicollis MX1]|eukprot:XP_001746117.1 hypothetical protein [Monosiga brevicollis MX1]
MVEESKAKAPITHFVSLPLANPALTERVAEFRAYIHDAGLDEGWDDKWFVEPESLHLTLCVLKLFEPGEIERALATLSQSLQRVRELPGFDDAARQVHLKGVAVTGDNPKKAQVLYAVPRNESATCGLQEIADTIAGAFVEAGLAEQQHGADSVLLHCTICKTSRAKKRVTFDASALLDVCKSFDFGKREIAELQRHEGQQLELKLRSQAQPFQAADTAVLYMIAFYNANHDGELLFGVTDDGIVEGLELHPDPNSWLDNAQQRFLRNLERRASQTMDPSLCHVGWHALPVDGTPKGVARHVVSVRLVWASTERPQHLLRLDGREGWFWPLKMGNTVQRLDRKAAEALCRQRGYAPLSPKLPMDVPKADGTPELSKRPQLPSPPRASDSQPAPVAEKEKVAELPNPTSPKPAPKLVSEPKSGTPGPREPRSKRRGRQQPSKNKHDRSTSKDGNDNLAPSEPFHIPTSILGSKEPPPAHPPSGVSPSMQRLGVGLTSDLVRLRRRLEESEAERYRLAQANRALAAQLMEVRTATESEHRALAQQLEAYVSDQRSEVASRQHQENAMLADLASTKERERQLLALTANLRAELAATQPAVASLADLQKQVQVLQVQLSEAEASKARLHARVTDLEADDVATVAVVHDLHQKVEGLTEQLEQVTDHRERLVAELERRAAVDADRLSTQNHDQAQAQETQRRLEDDNHRLRNQVGQLTHQLEESRRQLRLLQEECASQARQIATLRAVQAGEDDGDNLRSEQLRGQLQRVQQQFQEQRAALQAHAAHLQNNQLQYRRGFEACLRQLHTACVVLQVPTASSPPGALEEGSKSSANIECDRLDDRLEWYQCLLRDLKSMVQQERTKAQTESHHSQQQQAEHQEAHTRQMQRVNALKDALLAQEKEQEELRSIINSSQVAVQHSLTISAQEVTDTRSQLSAMEDREDRLETLCTAIDETVYACSLQHELLRHVSGMAWGPNVWDVYPQLLEAIRHSWQALQNHVVEREHTLVQLEHHASAQEQELARLSAELQLTKGLLHETPQPTFVPQRCEQATQCDWHDAQALNVACQTNDQVISACEPQLALRYYKRVVLAFAEHLLAGTALARQQLGLTLSRARLRWQRAGWAVVACMRLERQGRLARSLRNDTERPVTRQLYYRRTLQVSGHWLKALERLRQEQVTQVKAEGQTALQTAVKQSEQAELQLSDVRQNLQEARAELAQCLAERARLLENVAQLEAAVQGCVSRNDGMRLMMENQELQASLQSASVANRRQDTMLQEMQRRVELAELTLAEEQRGAARTVESLREELATAKDTAFYGIQLAPSSLTPQRSCVCVCRAKRWPAESSASSNSVCIS